MTQALTHSESIFIAAPVDAVYATVSDVTRTGEWSPVCKECWWDESDSPEVGAHFTGRNVTPERVWETWCEVIAADPGKAFGWSVTDGNVEWIYTMAPEAEGTRLTESWEFTPKGQEFFAQKFGEDAPEEIEKRRVAATAGIPATLTVMKHSIEQTGQ